MYENTGESCGTGHTRVSEVAKDVVMRELPFVYSLASECTVNIRIDSGSTRWLSG